MLQHTMRLVLNTTLWGLCGVLPAYGQVTDVTPKDSPPPRTTDSSLSLAVRAGLVAEDIPSHGALVGASAAVPVLGISVVGRISDAIAESYLPWGAGTWAASVIGGEADANGVSSSRIAGELYLMAPTNGQFAFATGYRYAFAGDEQIGGPGALVPTKAETAFHSLRIGATGALPIFERPDSRFSASFFLAGGIQSTRIRESNGQVAEDQSFLTGPEVILGYGQDVGRFSIDLRYRSALYFSDFSGTSKSRSENSIFLNLGYLF